MKKYIVTIIILCLMVSGCGKLKNPPDSKKVYKAYIGQRASTKYTYDGNDYTAEEKDEYLQSLGKVILKWYIPDSAAIIDPSLIIAINNRLEELDTNFCVDFIYLPDDDYIANIDNALLSAEPPDIITTGYAKKGACNRLYHAYINNWFEILGELTSTNNMFAQMPSFMYISSAIDGKVIGIGSRLPIATDYIYSLSNTLSLAECVEMHQKKVKIHELIEYFDSNDGEEVLYFMNDGTPYAENYINGLACYVDPYSDKKYTGIVVDYNARGKVVNLFEDENAVNWFKSISDLKKRGHYTDSVENATILVYKNNARDNREYSMDGSFAGEALSKISKTHSNIFNARTDVKYDNCFVEPQGSITGICKKSVNKEIALNAFYTLMNDEIVNNYLLYGMPERDYIQGELHSQSEYREGTVDYFGNPFVASQDAHYMSGFEIKDYYLNLKSYQHPYVDLSAYTERIEHQEAIIKEYIEGLYNGDYADVEMVLKELNDRLYANGLQEVIDYINDKS